MRPVGVDLGQILQGDLSHARGAPELTKIPRHQQRGGDHVVAVAERSFRRRGADVFESRRVLAAALIAPAVIFILLLVGTPFVLAIYLSFTDATAGSLSGHWVGFHNFSSEWHDPIFRHAVATPS